MQFIYLSPILLLECRFLVDKNCVLCPQSSNCLAQGGTLTTEWMNKWIHSCSPPATSSHSPQVSNNTLFLSHVGESRCFSFLSYVCALRAPPTLGKDGASGAVSICTWIVHADGVCLFSVVPWLWPDRQLSRRRAVREGTSFPWLGGIHWAQHRAGYASPSVHMASATLTRSLEVNW